MIIERDAELERRAAVHAALADATRLRIVDLLSLGDASSSELARELSLPSNLLAHHLNVLEDVGLLVRRRSEGDRRRSYLRLADRPEAGLGRLRMPAPERVVFVCTANSARSHLAAALWRRESRVPCTSAGTHPADSINPGAVDAARRRDVALPRRQPRHLDEVLRDGDLVVTVCDRAHEELGRRSRLHWSVSDPVPTGTDAAFDAAFDELATRVTSLRPRLDTTQ